MLARTMASTGCALTDPEGGQAFPNLGGSRPLFSRLQAERICLDVRTCSQKEGCREKAHKELDDPSDGASRLVAASAIAPL